MDTVKGGSTEHGSQGDARVVDEALGILTRAQALADQLRAEVRVEVDTAQSQATQIRAEIAELSAELRRVETALTVARSEADRRLAEAHAEAETLVTDATDQAALLRARATKASDEALAIAEDEAARVLQAALDQATDLRERAEREHATSMERLAEEERHHQASLAQARAMRACARS